MRIFVIGSGAREHALVARCAAEVGADAVLCAPGNPGIAALVATRPIEAGHLDALADAAVAFGAELTIVGPELPLSLGVVERFEARGLAIFGPSSAAARLESSKAFAKAFMARHGVPTARFEICESAEQAMAVIDGGRFGVPVVLKADGLAAGKGVVVAQSREEALDAIRTTMEQRRFGEAGSRIVIEECLSGPEVSFFVISDGARTLPIGTAQDHKRIFDGDHGPNTGGMGAFAPSPLIDAGMHDRVMREIVEPVVAGMAAEGQPFRGFLYVGLMLTEAGPKVIEFNVRLGDPEAQVILPLIAEPLVPLLAQAARGALVRSSCALASRALVGVVLASRGYPESSSAGQVIGGIDEAVQAGAMVYHAGTASTDGQLVTAGGRVLTVVAEGATCADAIAAAYRAVGHIHFDGMQYRRDIGAAAVRR